MQSRDRTKPEKLTPTFVGDVDYDMQFKEDFKSSALS